MHYKTFKSFNMAMYPEKIGMLQPTTLYNIMCPKCKTHFSRLQTEFTSFYVILWRHLTSP